MRPLRQSQRGGFVTKARIGQRQIAHEDMIFRLFFVANGSSSPRACRQLS